MQTFHPEPRPAQGFFHTKVLCKGLGGTKAFRTKASLGGTKAPHKTLDSTFCMAFCSHSAGLFSWHQLGSVGALEARTRPHNTPHKAAHKTLGTKSVSEISAGFLESPPEPLQCKHCLGNTGKCSYSTIWDLFRGLFDPMFPAKPKPHLK